MEPVQVYIDGARKHIPPLAGVYVLYEVQDEQNVPLYVGRTGKGEGNLRGRLGQHTVPSSDQNEAPLARQLACQTIGVERGSAAIYETDNFKTAFEAAKKRVRTMSVRWVTEPDPDCRYLLEFYAAKELRTHYNDFGET